MLSAFWRWCRRRKAPEPARPEPPRGGTRRTIDDAPAAPRTSALLNGTQLSPNWDRPLVARGMASDQPQRDPTFPRTAATPADPGAPPAAALREAFTPRQPKRWRHLFVGRSPQIDRAMSAMEEEHAHLVLYGERGRGKTSLANVLAELAAERGYVIVRCAGSAEITFELVLRRLLEQISPNQIDGPAAAIAHSPSATPEPSLSVAEMIGRITRLTRGRFLLVIDEFDRITDPSMRNQLAESIKNFSDIQARVVWMIVGVATSLDALLGAHPSIQRNIIGIHVPLMAPDEVDHLIAAGAEAAAMTFDPLARAVIADLAKGLPYFVQLLCLYAARNALQRTSRTVEARDVRQAAHVILDEAEPNLVASYERAAAGIGKRWSAISLSTLAQAQSDVYGVFSWAALQTALPSLGDAELRSLLDWLCGDTGGRVLQPAVQAGYEGFAFANPSMRQYVLLRGFIGSEPARPATAREPRLPNQDSLDKTMRFSSERLAVNRDSA